MQLLSPHIKLNHTVDFEADFANQKGSLDILATCLLEGKFCEDM